LIVIDANLLLYAYNARTEQHLAARAWLNQIFASAQDIGLPMQSILAFIRISTNPRLSDVSSTIDTALAVADSWLTLPHVRMLVPGPEHWAIFKSLCLSTALTGDLSTDAHLAALAMEYNATLYSTDRDFARFPGLRWANPLVQP
jgi:toxin-antitoxin system PIN domain toxin